MTRDLLPSLLYLLATGLLNKHSYYQIILGKVKRVMLICVFIVSCL